MQRGFGLYVLGFAALCLSASTFTHCCGQDSIDASPAQKSTQQSKDPEAEPGGFRSFLGLIAQESLGIEISWYMSSVYDVKFPAPVKLIYRANPRPTTNQFHNKFADPYELDSDLRISARPVEGFQEQKGILLMPNVLEIKQMRRELKGLPESFGGKPLLLKSYRRPIANADSAALRRVNRMYDLDVQTEDVLYVVPLGDRRGEDYRGFAVKLKDKTHFLIDSE